MAPTLRQSTQAKTQASADAAVEANYKRQTQAPRKPMPRNKRFRSTKGLINLQKQNGLQHITDTNANSPLLRLPPEIRDMIFKLAMQRFPKIGLYFNSHSRYSISGASSHAHKRLRLNVSLSLPGVCRQIYAETATLIYSVNKFAFATQISLKKWLSRRLPAQLEAIEKLELNSYFADDQQQLFTELKRTSCPNLRSFTRIARAAERVDEMREESWSEWEGDYVSTDDERTLEEILDEYDYW